MSVIEREARAQWDAMTDDERWSMHWTVRGNRADAKLAADRLEHQLEGAVRELRALMEAADEEARSQYEAPARLREAILRADRWLTASGSSG